MIEESRREDAATSMRKINQAWLDGRLNDLAPLVHPEIVMVFPGFSGRVQGRDAFLAGFEDFCQSAIVHQFREDDRQVDVVGDTAVVSFRYEMIYERAGERYRATGRDLWVFECRDGVWLAIWRTMLELQESAA
jgi:uncharacterized protein (TIGR02246 family)